MKGCQQKFTACYHGRDSVSLDAALLPSAMSLYEPPASKLEDGTESQVRALLYSQDSWCGDVCIAVIHGGLAAELSMGHAYCQIALKLLAAVSSLSVVEIRLTQAISLAICT
jgi:hypothetical protein